MLQICPILEKITVIAGTHHNHHILSSASIFYGFNRCILQKPNATLVVKHEDGKIRNKLMHWVGYDPNRNFSNVQLLDLAKQSRDSNLEQRKNALDLVLGYLGLNSLQALSRTDRTCSQLVESYVKRHSQQHGMFTIKNGFFSSENGDYQELNVFAEYVYSLRISVVHCEWEGLERIIDSSDFVNLNKLYVSPEASY